MTDASARSDLEQVLETVLERLAKRGDGGAPTRIDGDWHDMPDGGLRFEGLYEVVRHGRGQRYSVLLSRDGHGNQQSVVQSVPGSD